MNRTQPIEGLSWVLTPRLLLGSYWDWIPRQFRRAGFYRVSPQRIPEDTKREPVLLVSSRLL